MPNWPAKDYYGCWEKDHHKIFEQEKTEHVCTVHCTTALKDMLCSNVTQSAFVRLPDLFCFFLKLDKDKAMHWPYCSIFVMH